MYSLTLKTVKSQMKKLSNYLTAQFTNHVDKISTVSSLKTIVN